MRRPVDQDRAESVVVTAKQETCAVCEATLEIYQHRNRYIHRLDRYLRLVRRDKKCLQDDCPGPQPIFRPPEDLRLALPRRTYGLDVTLEIGERHVRGEALAAIGRNLNERGIPVHQTHVGRLFRDFLAVTNVTVGDDERLRAKLREQGGIVLQADGVQFDAQSPVLYVAWDTLSGQPLFGERKEFRSAEDLCPILERVKAMDVPIIGVVSDKEKGLVPAILAVFPGVPFQYCHTHYFTNCAKPLKPDLTELAASVSQRAESVRKIARDLHKEELKLEVKASRSTDGSDTQVEGLAAEGCNEAADQDTEKELVREICELVRQNSRVTGRPPFSPTQLKRHERLEGVRELVDELRRGKKKTRAARIRRWVGGFPLAGQARCGP